MNRMVTGKYQDCVCWDEVLEAASQRKHLKYLVEQYWRTRHPGCLNAIMDNADANLWITYHTGRIVGPA